MVHINEEMMSNKIKYVPQCSCLQTKQILSLFCKLLWDELQLNSGMSQGVYEWIKAEPDIHKMLSPWQYLIKITILQWIFYTALPRVQQILRG